MEIKHVTVSGAGLMGTQIAMQVALHGYQVTTYDVFPAQLEKAKAFADDWFAKRVQKGKLSAEAAAKHRQLCTTPQTFRRPRGRQT